MKNILLTRVVSIALVASTAILGSVQCIGSFPLFHKVLKWNQNVSNKWVNWLIFFLFSIFWVYWVTFVIDILILNSIEFWTGKSPISHNQYDSQGQYVKVEKKGDEKLVSTYRNYGQELEMAIYKKEKLVKTLLYKKDEPGKVFTKKDGEFVPVTMEVKTEPTGKTVSVYEGEELTTSHFYTHSEYKYLMNQNSQRYASAIPENSGTF